MDIARRSRRFAALLVVVVTFAPSPAAGDDGAASESWPLGGVPGRMIVTAATPAVADAVQALDGGVRLSDRSVLLVVEPGDEAAAAARLAGRAGVLDVEPDRARHVAAEPSDPGFEIQWTHDMTGAEVAWDETVGTSAVKVAIIDTGVDGRHEDLRANIAEQVDVSSGQLVSRGIGTDNDTCDNGHGTAVAGVVGAVGDNATGIAGVAWDVGIVDISVTSSATRCGILDSAIIAALDHAVTRGVDVANLSLSAVDTACPTAVQAALDDARDAGVVVVAAAGNEEGKLPGATSVPASCNGVLSVGAVDELGVIADYSQRNPLVDLVGPGGDLMNGDGLVTTAVDDEYQLVQGTSFSAPYVAGVAALLRSVDPGLTPDDIEWFLESTAIDKGLTGHDTSYGWGIVDAGASVGAVAAGAIPEPPVPDASFTVRDDRVAVERVAPATVPTKVIAQAVAMSKSIFESKAAVHVVLARADDFADALAGSALGYGVGPVLFTQSTGPLHQSTKAEIERVLEEGSTVYLLGGTAALPSGIEAELRAMGMLPNRLAGPSREVTAVVVAEELERFLTAAEFERPPVALVATAFNWPDAVTAGSFGALFGMPILLTSPDALHPTVAGFLAARTWDTIYVVGGTAAISEATKSAVRASARVADEDTVRLAGVNRSLTAVAVARELEAVMQDTFGLIPQEAHAVNLRAANGFAHVLSATARTGQRSAVFVPVEGEAGDQIDPEAQRYACRFPVGGVVVGGSDVVSDATLLLFDELLRGDAEICQSG